MGLEQIGSLIFMSLFLVLFLTAIVFSVIRGINSKRDYEETKARADKDDQDLREFRDFLRNQAFNPKVLIDEYLDGKTVVLSKTEYFVYDKSNPKYKVEYRINYPWGLHDESKGLHFLVCLIEGGEEAVVIAALTPEEAKNGTLE